MRQSLLEYTEEINIAKIKLHISIEKAMLEFSRETGCKIDTLDFQTLKEIGSRAVVGYLVNSTTII